MPKFDAGKLADALEFDFRGAGVDAHGTIPEPSDAKIGTYLDELKEAGQKLAGQQGLGEIDVENPAAVLKALDQIDARQFVSVLDDISKAAAKLCGGTPTLAQIRALPLRVRQHFFGYLYNEVINPEVGPGAGTPGQTTALRAVGA